MKTVIYILILGFSVTNANSQCLSLSELLTTSTIDIEGQDKLLSNKGYYLTDNKNNLIENSIEWYNQKFDIYVNIVGANESFDKLLVRFKSSNCFDSIREEIIKNGFKKDFEKTSKTNTLYFYYSNPDFGIVLSKWKAPEDYNGSFSNAVIYVKQNYLIELEKEK